jgi:hypothetical protein
MPDALVAFVAFVQELTGCGQLDGGQDNGRAWLECSCGAVIEHPLELPKDARPVTLVERRPYGGHAVPLFSPDRKTRGVEIRIGPSPLGMLDQHFFRRD